MSNGKADYIQCPSAATFRSTAPTLDSFFYVPFEFPNARSSEPFTAAQGPKLQLAALSADP